MPIFHDVIHNFLFCYMAAILKIWQLSLPGDRSTLDPPDFAIPMSFATFLALKKSTNYYFYLDHYVAFVQSIPCCTPSSLILKPRLNLQGISA